MLALGAFRTTLYPRLRPLNFTSIPSIAHRRLLSSSNTPLARPNTWQSRLWYRRDGTPRSKREGAIYVALALSVYLPYRVVADTYLETEILYDLIHFRRINSYCEYDFSKPEDMVEYLLKIAQANSVASVKDVKVLKEGCLFILKTFPEMSTLLRKEIEEFRDLVGNIDLQQDTLETAWAAQERCERMFLDLVEKMEVIQGLKLIKEERQKSETADLYQEVG